jgi:hypothetical protein
VQQHEQSTRKTALALALEGVAPDPRFPRGNEVDVTHPCPAIEGGVFVREESVQDDFACAADHSPPPGHVPASAVAPDSPAVPAAGSRLDIPDGDIEGRLSEAERAAPGTELALLSRKGEEPPTVHTSAVTQPARWWGRWLKRV